MIFRGYLTTAEICTIHALANKDHPQHYICMACACDFTRLSWRTICGKGQLHMTAMFGLGTKDHRWYDSIQEQNPYSSF